MLGKHKQRIAYNRNHCKLLAFAMSDGNRYAVHGSLNLRRCNSFEQMAIANDADTYNFFRDYIDDAFAGKL